MHILDMAMQYIRAWYKISKLQYCLWLLYQHHMQHNALKYHHLGIPRRSNDETYVGVKIATLVCISALP